MLLTVLNILPLFLNRMGAPQILIIVLIILLLFGGKKIPELMRGLGRGVRSFKQGLNDATDEINSLDADQKEEKKK